MCGITGFLSPPNHHSRDVLERAIRSMATTLRHRGPDDGSVLVNPEEGLALGFRRLAIIDLSPKGRQPMESSSGRFVIVFNGEIYNFRDLRVELETLGAVFKGGSDTEVLLHGFEHWGVQTTLSRAVGMFALAIWDQEQRSLTLARDRMGEKPLYYGFLGPTFAFGSELKALMAHPEWRGEIDRDTLALFFRFNSIPGPHSIYKQIFKLPQGNMLIIRPGKRDIEPTPYWDLTKVVDDRWSSRHHPNISMEEAENTLHDLLLNAVGNQMIADVPLGAFLSGGIDSSLIVALMQAQSQKKVRTFTIGFDVPGYNEAEFAKAVAAHLGTEHTELYASPGDALAVVDRLPEIYDEPFADSSQIPTYLVSRLTREHVTVSLSGDGGDELFGGYTRYQWVERLWNKASKLPMPLRRALAAGLTSFTPATWDRIYGASRSILPARLRQSLFGEKIHRAAPIFTAATPLDAYRQILSWWPDPAGLVVGSRPLSTRIDDAAASPKDLAFVEIMQFLDQMTYLPDDILTKVDRASMAVSLESRAPFLDHRVVEFSWGLPMPQKIRAGQGKWILRRILSRYVPEHLFDRPKTGFGVPIDAWLRGPLKKWAEDLLNPVELNRYGLLRPAAIQDKWREHLSGKRNWQHHLWSVLMFQAWLRRYHPL